MTSALHPKQVLVALGLDDADEAPLRFLRTLASPLGIEHVQALHVLPGFDLLNALLERETDALLSSFDMEAQALSQLRQVVDTHFGTQHKVQTDVHIRRGDPLEEIIAFGQTLPTDLLVTGKHSGGSAQGVLSGNLIRKARSHTLVVPDHAQPRLARLLVPVDFSRSSIQALQMAVALCKAWSPALEVTLVHVYDLPSIMAYRIRKTQEELHAILEEDRLAALNDFLRQYVPALQGNCTCLALSNDQHSVAEVILDAARRQEADLIIMGAKGHSKVELLLMGSVTESLLQMNDTIPLWIVK